MGSLLDKVKKLNNSLPTKSKTANSGFSDIWHQFKEGDNNIRLVGEFIQVRSHYLAPNPKKKMRGLCMKEAFEGENKLPFNVNCADWDIATETEKKEKTCVICRLNKIANSFMKEKGKLKEEENKFYFALRNETSPRNQIKWNIIDRDDPYVTQEINGEKKKVLGLKITQIGAEAWKDISGIFDQIGFDITDPVEGIDLIVNKADAGRVSYSVKSAMKGLSVKQTPFTAEEKALVQHDLRKICGKQADQAKILDSLHLDLRAHLDEIEEAVNAGNTKVSNSSPMAALKEKLGAVPSPKVTVTVNKPASSVSNAHMKAASNDVPDDAAKVNLDDGGDWNDYPTDEQA